MGGSVQRKTSYYYFLRRKINRAAAPRPASAILEGSGTTAPPTELALNPFWMPVVPPNRL